MVCHVLFNFGFERKILALKKSFASFVIFAHVGEILKNAFHKNDFFSNLVCVFSQNFSNFGETFQENRQKAFYMSRGTLLQKHYVDFVKQFRTLGNGMSDLRHNFAALLIKLLFCLQMGNWKNSFEGNFTFSVFFRTSRERFLVFFGVWFEAWWSKLNSTSQEEHIH